jgi:transcriptional regulator with XRE-family HTH domain
LKSKLRDRSADVAMGQRMRRIREINGKSREQIATRLGICHQQLWKYETGSNSLTVTAMKKTAAALGTLPCSICGCRREQ